MGKVAVLEIRCDDSGQGFLVSLQICQDDGLPLSGIGGGRLPNHPDIESCYLMWQTFFRGLKSRGYDRWEIEPTFTQRSTIEGVDACREWVKSLETYLQNWLQESSDRKWQQIREKLVGELARNSPDIRVMIKAHPSLWKLPWHSWDLFNSYPDLGISFSPEDYEHEQIFSNKGSDNQANILAVFGDDDNIDLQPDRQVINKLKDAKTEILNQPTASDFIKKVRQESGWDILFFAGHSETKDNVGKIYISKDVSLEIEQFKNALKSAINNGLKIAIFNSCEGLGLAEQIAKLQIPIAIFMQEKVPDRVAQSFLQEFLTEYANGQPLHTAFRRAQSRLEEFTTLPGATWLPKLYQNLGETPPTWEELRDKKKPELRPIPPPIPPEKPKFKTVLIASFIVTSLVMGVRSIGWLQSWELKAYDRLMRSRPPEQLDNRILVVKITENDIQQLKTYPITDKIMLQLLLKLEKYQPKVIGLDIYRDLPQEPGYAEFIKHIQKSDRFIAMCEIAGTKENRGIPSPRGIPKIRQGFNDIQRDYDGIIRRHLLAIAPENSPCQTDKSFNLQVARRYLKYEGIELEKPNSERYFKLGKAVFKPLEKNAGGYYNQEAWGYQVMLNYRSPIQVASEVTLTEVLQDKITPDLVKNRIVLIGLTARSVVSGDYFRTPYSAGYSPIQETPGVILHAQMVSQILSAVLDNRPVLWVWPKWGEILWVWCWSVVGGLLTLRWQKQIYLALTVSATLAILYVFCFLILLKGGWIPFIPSALVSIATSISVVVYASHFNRQHSSKL